MRSRWHVRANAVVLAWLVAAAVVALAHRSVPSAEWLMVHLLLLGGASTAILVWSAHFAEAVRRRPLPGGHRHQAIRLAGHTAGSLAVVVGMTAEVWPATLVGGTVIAAGAVWHAAALVRQGRDALGVRLGWTAWFFVASTAMLPLGVAGGVALARGASGDLAARLHLAHVLVLVLGWIGLAVMGTLVTLWPTMLRVQLSDDSTRGARQGLALLLAGLGAVVAGAGTGVRGAVAAGLAVYAAGLLRSAWPLVDEARRRPPDTFASRSVALAFGWMVLAAGAWAVLVALAPDWAGAQARVTGTIGPVAVGFVAQVLLGSLAHLGPMVLGGGPSAVRAAKAETERGGSARLVLVNGGLVVFLAPTPSLVRVAVSVLVLAALVWGGVTLVRAFVVSRRLRASGPQVTEVAELLAGRGRSGLGGALAAGVALVLVTAGAVAADPAALGLGAAADGGVTPTGRVVEVEVSAGDMRFYPDLIEVDAGDRLVLHVTNDDSTVHDLVLDTGDATGRLAAGADATIDLGVVGRDLDGWCSVAGHRQMGMVLSVVARGAVPEASEAGGDHDHATDSGGVGQAGESPAVDFMASPAAGFEPWDPVLDPAPAGTVHEVRLEVTEQVQEVAPGVRQTVWTFGGTFPGPTLRGKVGDTFVVTLVNDGTIGHSIDFHAGALAPDEPMRTIEPGEELTYVFTATRSGIWMYHCSTMPMSLHIANGMAGAVVIDPPDLPEVDREYLVVQSELYLGPRGGEADAAKIAAETPDAVVFNGYVNQYRHAPLTARVGERVRIWVLDVGPNRPSAFHVVGGQFDTVFLEGAWTLGGPGAAPTTGGSQVLGLHPAQGGFVELVLPEAGHYPMVSHLMVDAERGAYGVIEVVPET